jgi:hypothetical protein
MMLFSHQVHSPKPRSGADVPGLAALAKRAPVPDAHERAVSVGEMIQRMGGGIAVRCANPRAVRPPADDATTELRKATGAYINPPIGRALAKIPGDPRDAPFVEPTPRPSQSDLDFLWSEVVSPDLRANLIHAVKTRTGAEQFGTAGPMLEWDNSVSDLRAAIDEMIQRIGPAASALSRILNGDSSATKRAAAMYRQALGEYASTIRKGAAVRKFHDVTKSGEPESDFDWKSYGRMQLHGHFDAADAKTAEIWRGSIARAPSLVNDAGFHAWGRKMLRKYNLSAPMAKGVLGYIAGSFA